MLIDNIKKADLVTMALKVIHLHSSTPVGTIREERGECIYQLARVSLAADKQILSVGDHLVRTSLVKSDKVKFQEWQFNCHLRS